MTTLFIGGLPEHTTESLVRETLEPVARVHATRVLRDDRDARCRGVAYVTVSDREQAEHAVRALDGSLLEGHRLRVDFAR